MADQQRWFKFWCSAPSDDDIQALPVSDRWAWAAFGAHTKRHGTRGRITVSATNTALAAEMGVPPSALFDTIKRLPHLHYEEGNPVNGPLVVTWDNWSKYQEDSTVAQRVARLRSKRREEESRREKNKKRTVPPSPSATLSDGIVFRIPASVTGALDRAPRLGSAAKLREPSWWQAHVRAFGQVDFSQEIVKAEAWLATKGEHRKDMARFLHNWLSNAAQEGEGK